MMPLLSRRNSVAKENQDLSQDPFTMAGVRSGVTVNHVPKKISSVCH